MFLFRIFTENMIVSECLYVIYIIRLGKFNLIILLIDLNNASTASLFLFTIHWSNSHYDFNCFAHVNRRFKKIIYINIRILTIENLHLLLFYNDLISKRYYKIKINNEQTSSYSRILSYKLKKWGFYFPSE